jgi:hypothetical protein
MVSNLQLNPGLYATAATPLLALVSNQTDIVADFRERACATPASIPMPRWCLMRCRGKSSRRTSPAAMPVFWPARKR